MMFRFFKRKKDKNSLMVRLLQNSNAIYKIK